MKFLRVSTGVSLWLAAAVFGQSFEVTSVKPNKSGSNDSSTNTTDGNINAENVSLRQLIFRAYGVSGYSLVGPAWLGDDKFDISAKQPGGASQDHLRS